MLRKLSTIRSLELACVRRALLLKSSNLLTLFLWPAVVAMCTFVLYVYLGWLEEQVVEARQLVRHRSSPGARPEGGSRLPGQARDEGAVLGGGQSGPQDLEDAVHVPPEQGLRVQVGIELQERGLVDSGLH